jgi:hypothetical protein
MKFNEAGLLISVKRKAHYIRQGKSGRMPVIIPRGSRNRTERHSMKCAREGNYRATSGDLASQLERSFNGIRPGRTGERDAIVQTSRYQNGLAKFTKELAFGVCVQVKAAEHAVADQVVNHSRLDDGMVVPVVERCAARQKINIFDAILVPFSLSAVPSF